MASDSTEPSRRKHHRSSAVVDSEEPSKRRKHRHHHHRSKKEKESKIEEISNCNDEARVNAVGMVADVNGSNLGVNYEMEEGEIVEDDEIAVVSCGIDDSTTEVCESDVKSIDKISTKSGEDNLTRKESKKDGRKTRNEVRVKRSMGKHLANAEFVDNGLPVEESGEDKSHYDEYSGLGDHRTSKKHIIPSPSLDKDDKGGHSRSRSKSPHQSRGRSRSRNIFEESSMMPPKLADENYVNINRRSDSDEERMLGKSKHYRHGSRDLLRERERERSSSLHHGRVDRRHSLDTLERDRAGGQEMDRERMTEKVRERERTRDKDRLREREKDRERDRDRERQKEKEMHRERERVGDRKMRSLRDTESSRGWSRDRNRDKDSDRNSWPHKYDGDDRLRYDQKYDETDRKERIHRGDREYVHSPRRSPSTKVSGEIKRDEDEQENYEERMTLQLAEQEEEDLNIIKEESRRRRLAILEKHKIRQSQQQQENHGEGKAKDQTEHPSKPPDAGSCFRETPNGQPESSDIYDAELAFAIGKSPPQNGLAVLEKEFGNGGLGEGTPKSEGSTDMFCDDIFGESPAGVRKKGKGDGQAIERSGLNDNWDDAEGYYSYRFGEILDGRYEIIAAHGKGVFSSVVRAKDLKAKPGDPEEVAVKVIRNNETMYKAGMEELVILKKLVGADPENRRHCVRFISSFKYRNHLCLVFESLYMNLREVLKKFGRNIGLKLTAVRAYTKQLFIALKHLRNCGVLHSDIKPDNMLVNEAKNVLKLCDFGNAMFAGRNEITPYLVSRFYRAPEIILGLPYDHPMDMWSVGCCLFELYTGKVLFPGHTNNDMLRFHMELKGPFPKKMLRKGAFTDQHFDQDLNFLATEEDAVTKKAMKRLILNIKPKDFGTLILGSPGENPKMLANFKDLLEKVFVLDPDKRLTVSQALSHPFITGK